jgi:hypothetical protein
MTDLADEARRLSLASALMRHARERAGDLSPDADVAGLLVAARSLAADIGAFEHQHRVRFEPGYPGALAGPERNSGERVRALFACTAYAPSGQAVGTVFTTLIAGRRPTVSVAPPNALVDWRVDVGRHPPRA